MWSVFRCFLVVVFIFCMGTPDSAQGQNTRSWTGLAAPDNNWTTIGNWNTSVPISGDTAVFNGSGNANTSISLGAVTHPIKTIRFDGATATPYTLGVLASGDKFNFDAAGSIVVAGNIAALDTINAAIQANGGLNVSNSGSVGLTIAGNINFASAGTLTVNNPVANATTTLGGNITDAIGQPGSLFLLATTTEAGNNNNFIINGANTYTGSTTIQVNTGTGGSIQLGSDSPFGTGPVTLTLVLTAPQFSAIGGTRTIGNAIKMSSGMTFTGTNSFSFTGPLTIINSGGAGRTLTNSITAASKTVTLGASPGSSTITLGNPVASGGDGIGKSVTFAPAAGATTIVNDVLQDPAAGGGVASGSVVYGGSAGGVTQVNGASTYTGSTFLNGLSTIKIGSDYNVGGTSGPFGTGTLTGNSPTNNILVPIGGNRTIANPVSMAAGGLTIDNDTGDTSSLTLAGPISMLANGRFLNNYFAPDGGTLTLGSAASPSTITLPTFAGQMFTINGTGATVINDVIQDASPAPSPAAAVGYSISGTVSLNAQNTYTGNTSLDGAGAIFRIGTNSNGLAGASFTAGPFGTGTVSQNSSTVPTFKPIGADRIVSNPMTLNFGFTVTNGTASEDPTGNHSLTLAGPITLGAASRSITNNLASGNSLNLGTIFGPSILSLGSSLFFQSQTGGGTTIINDTVSGVGGLVVQNGAVVQLNGTANYTGATQVTGTGGPKLLVNGTKTGGGGLTIDSAGTLGGSGSINGTITNNGTIAPGNSIGTLTTLGNVIFNANSHLAIELNGGSADKLVVGGNLNLGASTDILDITGSGQGLSWVIATYAGVLTGQFNNVTPGYTVNYGTGTNSQITLNKAASGVNGDFNDDGIVDAGDYLTWRKNNGTSNALPNSNGLGTPIDSSYYALWRNNFGKPSGRGSSILFGGGAVPEPAGLLLALCGVVVALSTCRAHRRVAT
jgi:hypothetical protein